jgi:hypothetical protein
MPITTPKSEFTSRRDIREEKHDESQKTGKGVYIKGVKNGKKEK